MNPVDTSTSKIAVILDTAALLAKYYRLLPRTRVEVYTTHSAVSEVKDLENKQALEEALNLGLLIPVTPQHSFVQLAMRVASTIGCVHKLSRIDLEIVALALQLQNSQFKVIVITDDYEIQNLLLYMGISFKPLKTTGIRELKVYMARCPTCGYVPSKPSEETCPFCGTKISRKRVT